MSFTLSHLLPGETVAWSLKIFNMSGSQVGLGGGTAGTYTFTSVGGTALYKSPSIAFGSEATNVTSGDHIVELYYPGETEPDIAAIVNIVDGVDNPLATVGTGLDAAGTRAALGLEAANLSHLFNGLVGKNVVTNNGDGTYDVAIRNAADNATLRTIRVNPTTGNKVVL